MPEELREWAQDTLTAMMAGLLFGGGKQWADERRSGAAGWRRVGGRQGPAAARNPPALDGSGSCCAAYELPCMPQQSLPPHP